MRRLVLMILFFISALQLSAENGYRLWLRYDEISDAGLLKTYRQLITGLQVEGQSPGLQVALKELKSGLDGLLSGQFENENALRNGLVIAGTNQSSALIKAHVDENDLKVLGEEGFTIRTGTINNKKVIFIAANKDAGVLYGVFHFLRLLQTHQPISNLSVVSVPKIKLRILNHWDNLDRYVERGYAGISIWNWHTLPGFIDQRYIDYARANASIGINGTVLTNVNANAFVLTPDFLQKVKALADVFRPYGLKVYLTARFSSPIEIGGLKTADPLDSGVREWWKQKTAEIYSLIPDFGGFLVKANSEGQPGPQDYNRSHADGANMLAEAVAPHGGIVMWRAFVYSHDTPNDRFKQAYEEFKPLDGKFSKNVMVQVKNGPIDFQPREPFSPLFGAMPKTPLVMEFQITQEYLGQATHLVFEAPLFKEVFEADTYEKGKGSTVSRVIDGSLDQHELSGIAGVSNIGNAINWTGHPFGQANWYAYGRLAWNHELNAENIAAEWVRQTFTNESSLVEPITKMMIASREAVVNYMTPLGLNHIMGYGHHYGPAPWYNRAPRADWNPVYFHRADSLGIGFDRTSTGSNALAQYEPPVDSLYSSLSTCPEEYLLWFHHLSWKHKMKSGRTLWEELCFKYNQGVDTVRWMKATWETMEKSLDQERYNSVRMLLNIQEQEAVWWRDACLSYFQTFSGMPIPAVYEQPKYPLKYYESLRFPYAPGDGR